MRYSFALPITALFIALSLTGCATYSWHHAYKGQADFGQDQYSCLQQAAKMFPVVMGQAVKEGYTTPARTSCKTTSRQERQRGEERTECVTEPSVYYPPQAYSVDLNQDDRNNAVNVCLNSSGWTWQKDEK